MCAAKRASLKDKNPLDDLFGGDRPKEEPASETQPEEPEAITQPPEDPGELRQTTLMAYEDQLNWLALKCIEARTNGGKAISKAEIIRSLIDLAMASDVDLSGIEDEDELSERLKRAIKGR